MRSLIISALLVLLCPFTTALVITSPTSGTILTPNNFTVTWQRNSTTDPTHVTISLVNSGTSGLSRNIGTNVTAADETYTISSVQFNALSGISNGDGWEITINSVPDEGNDFVTQSEEFRIEGEGGNPTTTNTAPISVITTSISLDASQSSVLATYSVQSSAWDGQTSSGSTTGPVSTSASSMLTRSSTSTAMVYSNSGSSSTSSSTSATASGSSLSSSSSSTSPHVGATSLLILLLNLFAVSLVVQEST